MPRFEVRLESDEVTNANGSRAYRITRLTADDADAAAAFCRRKEFKIAALQLEDDHLAALEQLEQDGELKGNDKAHLYAHRQQEPYTVVSVTEIEEER